MFNRMHKRSCKNIFLVGIVILLVMMLVFQNFKVHHHSETKTAKYNDVGMNIFDTKSAKINNEINCTQTKTTPNFTICVHKPSIDIYVSKYLLDKGIWEKEITELFVKILDRQANSIFVDLGANIGYYSILAAKLGHMVVAVEPVIDQVERLHKSLEIQNLEDSVVIIRNALSDTRKKVFIKKSSNNQGDSRMQEKINISLVEESLVINTILLNDLVPVTKELSKLGGNPEMGTSFSEKLVYPSKFLTATAAIKVTVVMKIDVQGFEHKVFLAADEFFDAFNVIVILMEWQAVALYHPNYKNIWNFDFPKTPEDESIVLKMMEFLYTRGYKPYSTFPGSFGTLLIRDEWFKWPWDIAWVHNSFKLF